MTTTVFCTFAFPGVHRWPNADNYLKHPHRHLFHVRAEASVEADDREIEFIDMRDYLAVCYQQLTKGRGDLGGLSCEQLAEEGIEFLKARYNDERTYRVDVSEDGENGATVYWP
jgi:hypothetical protein